MDAGVTLVVCRNCSRAFRFILRGINLTEIECPECEQVGDLRKKNPSQKDYEDLLREDLLEGWSQAALVGGG